MPNATAGDLALLLSDDGKRFLVRLTEGKIQHTHQGMLAHDEIIGTPLGRTVKTHLGKSFLALEPSLYDLLLTIKRSSQIMYPKEIGYTLLKLNVGNGKRVIEAGSGSGALCVALAHSVCPDGRVYSYDVRADMLNLAQKNLVAHGLDAYVDFKLRDIAQGFDETDVDACFLDVREPWWYLDQVKAAVKPGGFFGTLVPTTNQIIETLQGLQDHGFGVIEVEELLLRPYKPVPGRLRPVDRMVAHTGYLIFARTPTVGEVPLAQVAPTAEQMVEEDREEEEQEQE
jgi:tRNA (adenine57-N1/adenine58-N1)-methyltransferase catalytic subunit